MNNVFDEQDASLPERQALVEQLKSRRLIRSAPVEQAFLRVPRHLFVPEADRHSAYNDAYIVTKSQGGAPISSCSQPSIVALMLEMLELRAGMRVLEVGAGTGYMAALMGQIVGESGHIVTVDLDEDLVNTAHQHLSQADVRNVQVEQGDGVQGWREDAPYDRIVLTCAAADVAPAWREQLAPNGRLLLPFQLTPFQVEGWETTLLPDQCLLALDKSPAHPEYMESGQLIPCLFMPLRGTPLAAPVLLTREPELKALSASKIDVPAALHVLTNPHQDEPATVHIHHHELAGLRLWLALRDVRYCELRKHKAASAHDALPFLLHIMRETVAAIGLYERGTWCLLAYRDTEQSVRPLQLIVRRLGPERALATHLLEEIEAWERAGRPFTWGPQSKADGMRVRVFPAERSYISHADESLVKRRWSSFVFLSQSHSDAVPRQHAQRDQPHMLTREEQLALLRLGKERWNAWRRKQPESIPDLIEADLSGVILKELDLRRARLNGARLVRADLFGSDLSGAQLCGADLGEVRAANVNLSGVDLRGTNLRNAFLVKANLNGAWLNGADLREARLKGTTLDRADLRGANLRKTHLNRVALNGADLTGAFLDELDVQDTDLPENHLWANQFWSYQRSSGTDEDGIGQSFDVKYSPRIVLKEIDGAVLIRGWNRATINVRSVKEHPENQPPELRQEQESIFITGGNCALEVLVPRIPHGIVTFSRRGNDTVTTVIRGERIRGDVRIEGAGDVALHDIEGSVSLSSIAGNVELAHVSQAAILTQIAGSVLIQTTARVTIDNVRGNVHAEGIEQTIRGNLDLSGTIKHFDSHIGGNANLHVTVPSGSYARLRAGGTIDVSLPEQPNVQVTATADGSIHREGRDATGNSGFATLTYGKFRATLDLTAGAGVKLPQT